MTWLDRLLIEDRGAMISAMVPEVEASPSGDRWAGPLFDPTLEPLCTGLPLEASQELREERAAILEYEAGFSREEAERLAGICGAREAVA